VYVSFLNYETSFLKKFSPAGQKGICPSRGAACGGAKGAKIFKRRKLSAESASVSAILETDGTRAIEIPNRAHGPSTSQEVERAPVSAILEIDGTRAIEILNRAHGPPTSQEVERAPVSAILEIDGTRAIEILNRAHGPSTSEKGRTVNTAPTNNNRRFLTIFCRRTVERAEEIAARRFVVRLSRACRLSERFAQLSSDESPSDRCAQHESELYVFYFLALVQFHIDSYKCHTVSTGRSYVTGPGKMREE